MSIQTFLEDLNTGNLTKYNEVDLQSYEDELTALTLKSYDGFAENYLKTVHTEDLTLIKHQEMEAFAAKLPEGAHVLILAAGSGDEITFFKDKGFTVEAIEPSAAFAQHLKGHQVTHGTLTDLSAFNDSSFDAAFCHAGILHLPDVKGHNMGVEKAFSEVSRTLKPKGYLFQQVRAGSGAYIQKETGRFFQLYSEDRLKELGESHGLKTVLASHIYKAPLPESFKEWISITYQKM